MLKSHATGKQNLSKFKISSLDLQNIYLTFLSSPKYLASDLQPVIEIFLASAAGMNLKELKANSRKKKNRKTSILYYCKRLRLECHLETRRSEARHLYLWRLSLHLQRAPIFQCLEYPQPHTKKARG